MTETRGAVYLTAAQDRAAFLTGAELAGLRETIEKLQTRPTTAGVLADVEGLVRLSRLMDLDEQEREPVVVLSEGEQQWLEAVRRQATIRGRLPLRIRRLCTACGTTRIENPARRAERTPGAGSGPSGQTLFRSAELVDADEPFLAVLNIVFNSGSDDRPAADQPAVCGRCDGDEFESVPITFCPACRAVRDETVLVRCPECDYDFLGSAPGGPSWATVPVAMAAQRNHAMLRERAAEFENGLWPQQLEALAEAIGGDEQLLALCRCALPGEVGRYVALLLTTQQLVWARESPVSAVKSGTVRWTDVRAVRQQGQQRRKYEWGVILETTDGETLVLVDFRGTGVNLGDDPLQFTTDHLSALMIRLQQRSAGRAELDGWHELDPSR